MPEDKLFDVAKPGATAAAPSSRPILMDRQTPATDPMVAGTSTTLAPSVAASERPKIMPPTPASTPNPPPGTTIATPKPAEPVVSAPNPITPAEEKDQKTKADAKEAQEQKARDEAVNKLAASKKYVVPIGEVHHSSIVRHVLLAAAAGLFICLVVLYLAIDAGLIHTSIKLPIDLIQNK